MIRGTQNILFNRATHFSPARKERRGKVGAELAVRRHSLQLWQRQTIKKNAIQYQFPIRQYCMCHDHVSLAEPSGFSTLVPTGRSLLLNDDGTTSFVSSLPPQEILIVLCRLSSLGMLSKRVLTLNQEKSSGS